MVSRAGKIRILIADDHPMLRFGLKKFLAAQPDMTVVGEAEDGEGALRLARELHPDILLLDLAMPRLPGMDTLRALHEGEDSLRSIVLTAAIEKSQIVQALQLGARGVVLKDAASEVLLKAIRSVQAGQYWVGRECVADLVGLLRSPPAAAEPGFSKRFGLTQRELEIVGSVVAGLTNKEIAQRLGISEETVKHHLTNVFDKTGTSNRLELAMFSVHHGLIGS